MRCRTRPVVRGGTRRRDGHTARLRNRIEAYLTGLAGAADTGGDSRVLGAGTTGSLVAIATGSPVAVGSGMVNTANAPRPAGREGCLGCREYFGLLHVYQILAHAPRSMTSPAGRDRRPGEVD